MIILNEKEFAENCLKNGLGDNNPYTTISILARYYYHCCGYRKKKISSLLIDFLSKYYPRYELNELSWIESVDKVSANAGKRPLHQINGVKITKSEIKVIENIHNKVLERLMFVMLCLAKLSDIKNPNNNGWVNVDSKDIFTYARISCLANERDIKIGKLWQMGLLEFSKRNDNLNCRVTFINDNDDEVLFISDFRELGYEYQFYNGGNFIRCAECGILTHSNKNGTKKYCKDCSSCTIMETKIITCIDCGDKFEINSKNNKSKRCPYCQQKYRRDYQRVKQQEYRKYIKRIDGQMFNFKK